MASPTLKVEIAFTSEPLDTTPTWVDVSQYVRRTPGVTITRGRGPGQEQFDAGYCQLTLSNRDRRFDPSHAAGPHFGNLIPRKQIRVTATWATIDYIQFKGWVTGWPQDFHAPDGKDATVTIEAFDALALLANMSLPNDTVYDYAATTIGSLAFFLRGADNSQWSDATSNGYFATPFIGTARFSPLGLGGTGGWSYSLDAGGGLTSSSLAPGMTSTAVTFDGKTIWRLASMWVPAGNWTYSFWVQTTNTVDPTNVLGGDDPSPLTGVYVTAAGNIGVSYLGAGTTFTVPPVNDGVPHHVVVTAHSSSGVNVYVDGVVSTTAPPAFMATKLYAIGAQAPTPGIPFPFKGTIQDVAGFNKAFAPSEVESLYNFSRGFFQESSTDRVTRLLDDVGWPASWRDLTSTSRATVGELIYNGVPVLSKLQEIQRSEQGRIFAVKAGNVAFRERYYAQEVAFTVSQIFSDDNGATALPFSTFGFQYNDIDVTNDVTVTTPTTHAAASDAASITANGRQSKKVDTILTTFDQANSMADGLVAQGKDPTWRVVPILVYPENNTTRWDVVLSLELGHRVSMEITPMAVGAQNVQEVTIEQMEWNIENSLWSFTVAGSPTGSPGGGGGGDVFFIVGSSLVGGAKVIGF